MAVKKTTIIDIYGGIAQSKKIGQAGSARFMRHLNIHDDPNDITLMQQPSKNSGSVVTGLIKWIVDATPYNTYRYAYDENGVIYKIDGDTWAVLQTTPSSHGQGMAVSANYLYYTQDSQIGRYGPLDGTPTFQDNWHTGLNNTSTTKFAPIIAFKEGVAVGHGNNVAWWDQAVWTADSLTLPAELNVRALTVSDQYIMIGAWRGTSIDAFEDGYVFEWDSLSDTFNDFAPTNGPVNAMQYTPSNTLLTIQGHQGYICTDMKPFNHLNSIPGLSVKDYLEIYPGAITTWKGLTLFGVTNTSSPNVSCGVYSYGSQSVLFSNALNFPFSISTGTESSNCHIGCVAGFGSDLYIAWQDGASYGVDKLTASSDFAAEGDYESLIVDDSRPGDYKRWQAIKASFLPLLADQSIEISFRADRLSSWSTPVSVSDVDAVESFLYPDNTTQNFKELEWRVTLRGDGSNTPTVTQQELTYDDLKEELHD